MVGNLLNQSLEDVWNGEKFRAFRGRLRLNRMLDRDLPTLLRLRRERDSLKPRRPLRALVRAAVFPIHLALALPWLALGLLVALRARVRPRPRRRRAVFLVPGADLASIREKFGSLEPFPDDAHGGYFERVHRYLVGTR